MQDTTDEKQGRVFMTIHHISKLLFLGLLVVAGACTPDLSDDQIPYLPFPDIVLNLNLPDNLALKSKGIAKEIDGGVRGIIVYCVEPGVYRAYERNCSYHPNEACATVNIDASQLYMFDPCCGSSFDFSTGNPMGGIAWRPLIRYSASYDGVYLTITDQVLN